MGGFKENTLGQYIPLAVKYNTIIHFLNTYCLHSLFKGEDR